MQASSQVHTHMRLDPRHGAVLVTITYQKNIFIAFMLLLLYFLRQARKDLSFVKHNTIFAKVFTCSLYFKSAILMSTFFVL